MHIDLNNLNLDSLKSVSEYLSFYRDWYLKHDCTNIYLDNLCWFDEKLFKEDVQCIEKLDAWFMKENIKCLNNVNQNEVDSFFNRL
jgi:hypothetical protein